MVYTKDLKSFGRKTLRVRVSPRAPDGKPSFYYPLILIYFSFMSGLAILASILFVTGYILITLEHRFDLNKALPAVALGSFLWILIGIFQGPEEFSHAMEQSGSEIFGLIAFLLAAMTLVEILTHYRFFDWIRIKILGLGFNDYKQLWVIAFITFFLSAIVDNLTATLVMLAIGSLFISGKNLPNAAAIIVIAANAGGAWSPIGDVTTIMLYLADKFTASQIILWGIIPSLTLLVVSTFMLTRSVTGNTPDMKAEDIRLTNSEKVIVITSLLSFLLPLLVSQIGLEPYFGLIFGLGIVGLLIAIFRNRAKRLHNAEKIHQTHLTSDLEKKLSRIDMASLLFFTGILLAVSALGHLGVLDLISHSLLGSNPSLTRYVVSSSTLGAISALVDNIPLTAAAIEIFKTTDFHMWVLLALTVGTGGSLLIIGSAAGIVAMSRVKTLTFFNYLKIATVPALVGYLAAIGVWYLQYILLA